MFVIKVYRAHKGETRDLENVLKTHWDSLHAAGLVSLAS
jgi:Holliday junction resolvase RusA-like endonuclease